MNRKIQVQYVMMSEDNDWIVRAGNPCDLQKAREKWRLAFTLGMA